MIEISNKKHWLVEQAIKHPAKTALRDSVKTLTYSQLLTYSISAAFKFKSIGVDNGNHVSIVSNNSIEFVITVNALWLLGAIPIPLNLKLKPDEIENLIFHSRSKVLLNINNVVDTTQFQFENIYIITFDDFATSHLDYLDEKFNPKNVALMMYSSGSTGNPKCVQLTFNNLFESVKSLQSLVSQDKDDVWLATLPFYHIGGFSILMRSLLSGQTVVFPKSTSGKDLVKSFTEYKPTYFSIVPTMLKKILEEKTNPWKGLKNIFIGGGSLNTEDVVKAINLGFPLVGVYGSTETASMVTAVTEKNIFEKIGCAGKPLTGNTIEIIDEKGFLLPPMEIGEIVISSNCIAKSYFNYSDDNGSKLSNQKFYSNDLGCLDEEGNLFLKGRKDDMIVSGGENIFLNEIENHVKSLEEVSDCTSVKISDEKWGESYILIVELKEKSHKVEEITRTQLEKNIASFKKPRAIHFVDKLYRNDLGKVDKNKHLAEL
ncbi:MAG: acyl--CoA ligase [Ignavibacteriae bacterium]|nr:acyl--CoA ligase [Ignavibacteriota bacterium]